MRCRSPGRSTALVLSSLCVAVVGCSDGSGPEPSSVGVSITAPVDGGHFVEGQGITFTANVNAPAGIDSVVWTSNLDGRIAAGTSVFVNDLSVGTHAISADAFSSGARDAATVTIRVDSPPDVSVLEPAPGSFFPPSATVTLVGEATDRDGGSATIAWDSNIDGDLGVGPTVEVSGLSLGEHTIRAVATDDEGQSALAETTLDVTDYSLGFDGVDDGASTPSADFDFTGSWTIEFWVKPFDASRSGQFLVSQWTVTAADQSFSVSIDEGRSLVLHVVHEGGSQGTGTFDVFPDDTWTHVAITFGDTRLRFYVNGRTVKANNLTAPQGVDVPLSLGRFLHEDGTSSAHFDGLMDEVRIWNVVRSQDEVVQNMRRRLTGSEPGLVAVWRMEAGEGDIVPDATGGGHTLQRGDTDGADAADPEWHFPGAVVR